MSHIQLNDLDDTRTLTAEELSATRGGWFYYYNVFNPYYNPWGYALQNSWIQRGQMFDAHNSAFLDYLRS
ncbi:MAG: hypothetical protein H6993_04860 [Pseudomonadales bacterium]|nr:hypothetical protein [Pseudomonadales bacterium]MCP5183269.1 hypothetical protein [Pseudomonadales bacterium]